MPKDGSMTLGRNFTSCTVFSLTVHLTISRVTSQLPLQSLTVTLPSAASCASTLPAAEASGPPSALDTANSERQLSRVEVTEPLKVDENALRGLRAQVAHLCPLRPDRRLEHEVEREGLGPRISRRGYDAKLLKRGM